MDDPSTLRVQYLLALTEMGCALKHLVEPDKVLELTRLDLGSTTLLMMLNILMIMMKTLVFVLNPLWTMEKPLMD